MPKYWKVLVVGSVGVLATACAPSTVVQLKQSTSPEVYTVDKNYQLVIRDLKNELSRCVIGGWLTAKSHVDSQLYPDLEMGGVAVRFNNMGDRSVFFQAEISKQGAGAKVVSHSVDFGIWKGYSAKVQMFINSGDPLCEA